MITDIITVLIIQLLYVPTFTLRTIFLVKGLKVRAAMFGIMETLVYVFGLSIVLTGDKEPIVLVIYAIGFGLGVLVGTFIEEKLAIGYTSFDVILTNKNENLINRLREKGYGVTIYEGEGISNKRYKLNVLTKRSQEKQVYEYIQEIEPRAFIIAYEPKAFRGGFIVKSMKKSVKKQKTKD